MMRFRLLLLFLLAGPASGVLSAQEVEQDFGMWFSADARYRLNRRWSLSIGEQVRLNRNLETVDMFFTEIGATYQALKDLKLSVNYRYIKKNELEYWSTRHGMFADAIYRIRTKPVEFTVRGRLQARAEDVSISDEGITPNWFFRTKLQAQYDFGRRYVPFISAEAFYLIHSATDPEMEGDFTRFRYEAGVDYEFNKIHSISISYMIQHNRSPILDEFIVTAGYKFNF